MRDLVLGAGVLEPLMLGLSQSQQQQQQHGFLTSFIRRVDGLVDPHTGT